MNTLEELQVLSLVAKLTTEIENYTGINDKTLAEFILNLYDESQQKSTDEHEVFKSFSHSLDGVGAEFPESFVEHMDKLIRQLHPRYKKLKQDKKKEQMAEKIEAKSKGLKGLTIPDNVESVKKLDEDYTNSRSRMRSPTPRRSVSPERDERYTRHDRYNNGRRRSPDDWDNRRYRDRSRSNERRPLLDEPVENGIYDARIRNITDYGAFATLEGFRRKIDGEYYYKHYCGFNEIMLTLLGLIHISCINGRRLEHPSEVLSRNDLIKVKILKIEGDRMKLSMKDVDQITGDDLNSINRGRLLDDGSTYSSNGKGQKKRLTSPERWEIRQLIASGVLSAADYPDLDDDVSAEQNQDLEQEEDVDIEVREEEPPFLTGQTKQSLELSPIRVVKAPDGSMNRAAMTGASMAKDRRETRQKASREKEAQAKQQQNNNNRDLNDPVLADLANTTTSDVALLPEVPEWKRATGKNISYGKRTNMSLDEQRKSLPVYKLRQQILDAVRDNQILIIVGDTGSGKTTQITQYLAEEGFGKKMGKKIGCTQPRRVAAVSVAKRVAEEVGCKVGMEVGYSIRFEDCTSDDTVIKYMTDGMLQREALQDPDMKQYSVVMLDEAHERTIATDVLFALLKKAAIRRPDLRLIVTSATLDAEKFSEYFNGCPILFIPGRTYPVDILYTKEPEMDYLDAALMTVMQIHLSEPPGDILVFLTGQEEIDTSCETLYERMKALGPDVPELIILPVYSALPGEMQTRIFDPASPGSRKVVIATNIAETSITIDGIYYVVDPGFVKINAYDPKLGMDSLVISPISQAQANQRAGRAGRTGPGKCYRLYTESAYQTEMLPNTIPEIQRQNLSHTILMLKVMGINDLLHFDFMDPPPSNTLLTALEELYQLSALDEEGLLTRLGKKMADFPMQPAMAKVLIASVEAACAAEILTIVAMLSVQTIFYRPRERQEQADQKKAKFHDPHGDHLTYLNVYNGWVKSGYSRGWCIDNFIQERSLRRAKDVREQLVMIMNRYRHPIKSVGNRGDVVRKVLCSGYFRNSARKDPQEGYKTLIEGTTVSLHPSSALFHKPAEYVIYHTLLLTTKEYMQCTTTIEPKWLVEAAPTFFKVADSKQLSKRKRNERIEPLFDRYASDKNEWRLSAQRRGGRGGGTTFA